MNNLLLKNLCEQVMRLEEQVKLLSEIVETLIKYNNPEIEKLADLLIDKEKRYDE